jgi:hypothetical protein
MIVDRINESELLKEWVLPFYEDKQMAEIENQRVINIGGRRMTFSDDQVEVYRDGEWHLHRYNFHLDEWRNYKLYRDFKAPKRVWYFSVSNTNGLLGSSEVQKLDLYHPGMKEWAIAAMDGVVMPLPEPLEPREEGFATVTNLVRSKVLWRLREAWDAGAPLSPYGQTRPTGRYAPSRISKEFGIKVGLAENLIKELLRDGVISVEMISTKTKMKGLKVRDA